MYSRKQILDLAFEDAVERCRKIDAMQGMGMQDIQVLDEQTMADFMRAYAERGIYFTEAEIHSTIVADVEALLNAVKF
ncbi:MAG: hypothetical protein ACLTK0_11960 [Anaerovoracaceae bacterium]